ncbi:MAG: hypothetical protein GY740_21990 [Gammaproteobacteria bacterium]|nr:hypothetical protein [Gammaproteobacteria bacterium]
MINFKNRRLRWWVALPFVMLAFAVLIIPTAIIFILELLVALISKIDVLNMKSQWVSGFFAWLNEK